MPRYCTASPSLEHVHPRAHLNPPHMLYSTIVSIFRPTSRGQATQSAGHAVRLHQKDRAMSGMPQIADGRAKLAWPTLRHENFTYLRTRQLHIYDDYRAKWINSNKKQSRKRNVPQTAEINCPVCSMNHKHACRNCMAQFVQCWLYSHQQPFHWVAPQVFPTQAAPTTRQTRLNKLQRVCPSHNMRKWAVILADRWIFAVYRFGFMNNSIQSRFWETTSWQLIFFQIIW